MGESKPVAGVIGMVMTLTRSRRPLDQILQCGPFERASERLRLSPARKRMPGSLMSANLESRS